jgi:hypothetical protein
VTDVEQALVDTVSLTRGLLDLMQHPEIQGNTSIEMLYGDLRTSVFSQPLWELHWQLATLALIKNGSPTEFISEDRAIHPRNFLTHTRIMFICGTPPDHMIRCAGTTKRGTQCRNRPLVGVDCCHIHATPEQMAESGVKIAQWQEYVRQSLKKAGVYDLMVEIARNSTGLHAAPDQDDHLRVDFAKILFT